MLKLKTLEAVSSMSTLSTLPEEIQVDIFIKLPLKSISISRCVCKLWCEFLSSPKFIKYHINHTIQNKKNHKLLLVDNFHHHQSSMNHHSVFSIDYASKPSSPTPFINRRVRMKCPSENRRDARCIEILGSCNGLVCLSICTCHGRAWKCCICIWNPLTRECKEILLPDFYAAMCLRHGFGYDCNIDTYKLVMIGDYGKEGSFATEVYTLGSDSWNGKRAIPYSFARDDYKVSGLLFNGALHWLGTNKETSSEVIVSYGIRTEKIVDVPLPDPINKNKECCRSVAVLGGNLCLLNSDDFASAEIWVMLEYGVRASWTRQVSITQQDNPCLNIFLRSVCPLENGQLLMVGSDKYVLYNPKKATFTKLSVRSWTNRVIRNKAVGYIESLVSPVTRVGST